MPTTVYTTAGPQKLRRVDILNELTTLRNKTNINHLRKKIYSEVKNAQKMTPGREGRSKSCNFFDGRPIRKPSLYFQEFSMSLTDKKSMEKTNYRGIRTSVRTAKYI
jgi:hypothetical protein